MNCAEVRPYLQAFADHELSPERAIDVQCHISECGECRAEVDLTHSLCRATRNSVTRVSLCPDFQSRLSQCLAEERKRQEGEASRSLSFWVIVPLAAAAGMALVFGIRHERAAEPEVVKASSDHLVDFLVNHHANSEESDSFVDLTEASDPASVARLEPELGFAVHAPDLRRFGARFEGAHMVPLDKTRVAKLRYNIGGRRVTFYMYDPEQVSMRSERALQPRVVGTHAVFTGNRRGYSIATCEQEGVGYAVTGALSREESAELVAAVYR